MVDTLYAYGYGLYLLLLSKYTRFLSYIFELINLGISSEHRLVIYDSDILSPILYEHSSDSQYVNSFESLPFCKTNNFIETKVAAIKLRGFNHLRNIKKNIAVSESGFVFNPTTGDSFSLNGTGLELLQMLGSGKAPEEIKSYRHQKWGQH